MLGLMKSKGLTDGSRFSWWTKNLPPQGGAATGLYTSVANLAAGTAYTAGVNAAGTVLYVKAAADTVAEFRIGHIVNLRTSTDSRKDVAARVTNVVSNGASSYLEVVTLVATTNGGDFQDPVGTNRVLIIGAAQEQGAQMPGVVNYNPIEMYNHSQIVETAYEITRTQMKTKLYTGDAYKEEKREKFELHMMELEKMFLWGERSSGTLNGKPFYTTMGMIPMIREYAPTRWYDFRTNATYAGDSWITSGKDWLDQTLEEVARYGNNKRTAFCGSGARLGITQLAEAYGFIQIKPGQAEFGMEIEQWMGPGGLQLMLYTHPLFSYEESNRYAMVIFDPANLIERPMDKTITKKRPEGEIDGKKESWLTETGLEFHNPMTFAYLDGIGVDNSLTP